MFKDGTRSIDFVLVYKNDSNSKTANKRNVFQSNLKKMGLELEEDEPSRLRLQFVKIHAPKDVCREYCEKLKLRMPTKKLKKTTIRYSSNYVWYDTICRWVSRKIDYDQQLFPSILQYETAVYSRDKEDIFDVSAASFFTPTIRATIVKFILDRTSFSPNDNDAHDFGIHQAYCTAYPLHEGDCDVRGTPRHSLSCGWASLRNTFRYQPLDHIREYFGAEIALYFTWLGFYTFMLLLPAILGSMCFLFKWSRSRNCLSCDEIQYYCKDSEAYKYQYRKIRYACQYCCFWEINDICLRRTVQSKDLLEDFIVILFTIFMCIWGALFLELWKQYFEEITRKWGVTAFNKHEDRLRPEYLTMLRHSNKKIINPITNEIEPKIPFWTQRLPNQLLAVICTIILVYTRLARHFTNLGLHRTQNEYDDSLTRKLYLFHSLNYYWPELHLVFLQPKQFIRWPTNVQISNVFTGEDRKYICGLDGCLAEISTELTEIMISKQAINALKEYTRPCEFQFKISQSRIIGCWWGGREIKKAKRRKNVWNLPPSLELKHWMNEYKLLPFQSPPMYLEYLEIVVQFGFVMLFAHAFPLAPLFALLNNVVEVRLDAKKMITFHRRPVPQALPKHFNIWYKIMDSIGNLAIFTNGFMIAFLSDFIPKMVYLLKHRNDGAIHKSSGYLLFSLSYSNLLNVECYLSYWYARPYTLTADVETWSKLDGNHIDFWICLAARSLFMLLFQNFMTLLVSLVRRYIRSRNVFCGSKKATGIPNDVNQCDKRKKKPIIVIET